MKYSVESNGIPSPLLESLFPLFQDISLDRPATILPRRIPFERDRFLSCAGTFRSSRSSRNIWQSISNFKSCKNNLIKKSSTPLNISYFRTIFDSIMFGMNLIEFGKIFRNFCPRFCLQQMRKKSKYKCQQMPNFFEFMLSKI